MINDDLYSLEPFLYLLSDVEGSGPTNTTFTSTTTTTSATASTGTTYTTATTSTIATTSTTTATSTSTTTFTTATTSITSTTSTTATTTTISTSTTTPTLINLVNELRDPSKNSSVKADDLISFFNRGNLTQTQNQTDSLTPDEVDRIVDGLTNITITNSNTALIMAVPVKDGNSTVVGGALTRGTNNTIIIDTTKPTVLNSYFVAAAVINDESINNTASINILILGDPKAYENLDLSNNQTVVSSVIVANVKKIDNRSKFYITLHFQVVKNRDLHIHGDYMCSFFDNNTSKWNQSGCTSPLYDDQFERYNCICNHLTTFALLWLPKTPQPNYLTSQDIVSLICLSLSIL
ncbi:unnamed protein product, partial [Adineta steineri]